MKRTLLESRESRINDYEAHVKLVRLETPDLGQWESFSGSLHGTPPLYAQEGKCEKAIVHLKLFDPAGSGTWFLLEWDGQEEAFSFCTGLDFDQYGYLSLRELALIPGRIGIGIEIDTGFLPKPLREAKNQK